MAAPKRQKTRTIPRKRPAQDRAQATVDALLTATARILVRDGYDRASTNRIAEEAGVSIGSLYQYFPSKEALVAVLVEQMIKEELDLIEPRLARVALEPLETSVRELVAGMIANHGVNPALRRIIIEQVPRVGRLEKMIDVQTHVGKLVKANLEARGKSIRPVDLEMASFILVHAVEAVIHATVFKRPEYLRDRRLTDEITEFVLRYLKSE